MNTQRTLRDPIVLGIVLVSLFLNLLELTWGLPALRGRGWDIDSIAPIGPLAAASGAFTSLPEGFYAAYPLFHYMVSALFYAPYVLFLVLTGGISFPAQADYPYGFQDPELSLSVLILISRLISVAMATGIVIIWYQIARRIFDRTSALVTAFVTATGFNFVYYAHAADLDVPYLFWTSLAVDRLVCIHKSEGRRPYLWLGVFSALAIATKDQAYGFFVLTFAYLILLRWKSYAVPERQRFWRDTNLRQLLGGFSIVFALASNLLLNPKFFLEHVHNIIFVSKYGSVYQDFLAWRMDLPAEILSGLIHGYGVPLVGIPLVCLGVIGLFRWRRQLAILLIPVASYVLTFLFLIGYSFDRWILGIVFVFNVAIGHVVSEWIKGGQRKLRLALVGGAGVLLFSSGYQVPRLMANDSRYSVEQYLAEALRPDDEVWMYSLGAEAFTPRIAGDHIHYKPYGELPEGTAEGSPPSTADLAVLVYMFPPASGPASGGERRDLFEKLMEPDSGFALRFDAKTEYLLDPDSLRFVNPQVYVFGRVSTPAAL